MFPVIWWIGKGSRKAAHLQLAVVAADFCGGKSAFEGPDALQVRESPANSSIQ
jgi:hypothetical protein